MKKQKITVSHGWLGPYAGVDETPYRVERVIDSIEFHPGQMMTKKQVNDLIHAHGWQVTIIPKK